MKRVPALRGAPAPAGPYSPAVVADGFVFVSGQLPRAPGRHEFPATIGDQTRQALRNIEAILTELGGSLRDVVKVTVFLASPADFPKMNEAYREFFPSEPPARSVARLGAELPGLLVSIEAIAVHRGKS